MLPTVVWLTCYGEEAHYDDDEAERIGVALQLRLWSDDARWQRENKVTYNPDAATFDKIRIGDRIDRLHRQNGDEKIESIATRLPKAAERVSNHFEHHLRVRLNTQVLISIPTSTAKSRLHTAETIVVT